MRGCTMAARLAPDSVATSGRRLGRTCATRKLSAPCRRPVGAIRRRRSVVLVDPSAIGRRPPAVRLTALPPNRGIGPPDRPSEEKHGMCNLSAEWVLEARRQDRDTQARRLTDPPPG